MFSVNTPKYLILSLPNIQWKVLLSAKYFLITLLEQSTTSKIFISWELIKISCSNFDYGFMFYLWTSWKFHNEMFWIFKAHQPCKIPFRTSSFILVIIVCRSRTIFAMPAIFVIESILIIICTQVYAHRYMPKYMPAIFVIESILIIICTQVYAHRYMPKDFDIPHRTKPRTYLTWI